MEEFLSLLNNFFNDNQIAINASELMKDCKITEQTIFKGGILDLSKITIIDDVAHENINNKLDNLLNESNCSIKGAKLHPSNSLDFINIILSALKSNKSLKVLDFSGTSFGKESCEKLISILRERHKNPEFPKLTFKLDNCWLKKSDFHILAEYAVVEISGASDQ